MGKTIQIRVDESLQEILERIRKEIAVDLKAQYNLDEITVNGTFTSRVLAAKLNGQKFLTFRIRKEGLNRGILELI